jgi:hypothetical protein
MGRGHGIGVKRNDYHRRNRRRNISTWSTSAGVNYPAPKESAERPVTTKDFTVDSRYSGFNENIWTQGQRTLSGETDQDEDWKPEYFIATSSLDPQRFLHIGPFSRSDEIKRQRFGDNPNDNWWLWKIRERVSAQSRHEFLPTVKKYSRPITY